MGWIGLGQNFRNKNMDWIGPEIDWIGLGWIKKIGPMSNSGRACLLTHLKSTFSEDHMWHFRP